MKLRFFLILFVVALSWKSGKAQFFYYGQEPASLQWKSFYTPHFNILYTRDASLQAYYFARLLEKNYRYFSVKENVYPRTTSVLLHSRDIIPNGFSVPAPLRMEISTVPSQSSTAQNWMQLLALHEFRHSLQIRTFEEGFARHLSWLFGDVAVAGAMSRLPFWFIEGEAVYTETAHTHGGRGRDSDFVMQWNAIEGAQRRFSYDKAVNGSFKDYVPGYYRLGYHLYTHGRAHYPDTLWNYVIKRTARLPFGYRPFSKALKNITDHHVEAFYNEAMDSLRNGVAKNNDLTQGLLATPDSGSYASYTHVKKGTDGAFYALKQTLDDIPAFVRVSEGEEQVLHYPGNLFREQVTFSQDKFLWSEYYTDPRWSRRNYSVVKSMDLITEVEEVLTPEDERHFSPDMDSQGRLVTVRYGPDGTPSLVVTDTRVGKEIAVRDFTLDKHIITPRWAAGEESIVYIEVTPSGKAVKEYHPDKDQITVVFKTTVLDISHPLLTPDYLFLVAPFRGRDELYAFKRKARQLFRVAGAPFGLSYPSLGPDKWIAFSRYSSDGFKPYAMEVTEMNWEPVAFPAADPFRMAANTRQQEIDYATLPEMSRKEKTVKESSRLLNFHSITPFGYSKNDLLKGPGVSVHSQNVFSTLFTSAGYFYDEDEDGGTYFADVEYRGWYPVLKLNASYGRRSRNATIQEQPVFLEWDRYRVSGGVEVPYQINAGKNRRFLSASVMTSHRVNDIYSPDTLSFTYDKVQTLEYNLYFHNLRRTSHRDLYPRTGQVIDLNLMHTPFNFSEAGYIAAAEGIVYLPGFVNNHHIWLYGGYQYQSKLNQPLSGFVSYPRGTTAFHHDRMFSAKATYAMPLAYPEWNVGPFAYFKRLKGAAFIDYAQIRADAFSDAVITTGAEITADTHLLRLIAPANIGARGIYDITEEALIFEVLFRMNFKIY